MKQALNPMNDIQKSIDMATASMNIPTFYDPLREINEHMKSIINPLYKFEKQMEYLYDPMKKINEQMEAMYNPLGNIQKELDSLYSQMTPNFSSLSSITKLANVFQESLNATLAMPSMKDQMDALSKSYSEYRKIGDFASASLKSPALTSLVDSIIDRQKEARQYISSIESIEVVSESILLQEIENIRENILEVNSSGNIKIEEYLFNLNEYIVSQKNPHLLLLFQAYILPIIMGIITSMVYDLAIKPNLEDMNTKQVTIKKEIIQQVKEHIPNPQVRVDYRIVKVDVLNVREGKSRSSKIISSLTFGEVVEIIRKEKNWSLIKRYNPESETYIQGWVFTRYLAQIR